MCLSACVKVNIYYTEGSLGTRLCERERERVCVCVCVSQSYSDIIPQ